MEKFNGRQKRNTKAHGAMPKNETSWGGVSQWYGDYMSKEGTYQSEVILPNILRVLDPKKGARILDLACGQGFFSEKIRGRGADVVGADISPELIAQARKSAPEAKFYVTSATDLSFAKDAEFDAVICILALQNIEDISAVFKEVRRVLKSNGHFIAVLNHPAFRVLHRSSWGFDEEQKTQYRRVDGYLSSAKIAIDMNPGKSATDNSKINPAQKSQKTISYHRSLQDFFKALSKAGLSVSRLEEWVSHKTSAKGPRQKAEDIARKEIPLFMMIEMRS